MENVPIAKIISIFALMSSSKKDIIRQLEREILPLEGLKVLRTDHQPKLDFPAIESAFPNKAFPVGCMHEFISFSDEDGAATSGFLTFLLGKFMKLGRVCIWVSASRTIFPPALRIFGVEPDQFIFIDLKSERDVLYTIEEALKCKNLTAVIGQVDEISFKQSRRLQLAAENSRVTGFILRQNPKVANTIACVSRWQITSLESKMIDGMPGVGFPRWNIELLKVRNGTPGNWKVEWSPAGMYEIKENVFSIPQEYQIKTG